MKKSVRDSEGMHMAYVISGVILFSVSYRFFLVPGHLYSGGFTGIAQLIKLALTGVLGLEISDHVDITGIVSWLLNIPLAVIGYRYIGKKFMLRTVIAVFIQSALMTFLPAPSAPVFSDALLNCIAGGCIAGYGVGLSLREGGSGGGTDIIGMVCAKKYPEISVGKISFLINFGIYLFAAWKYDIETAAYSIVFSFAAALVLDRVHYQNINMTAFIISKDPELGSRLTRAMGRGVTSWNGWGEYTGQGQLVHMIVVNKYEFHYLKKYVNTLDPSAFAFVVSSDNIIGKYEKRLEVI